MHFVDTHCHLYLEAFKEDLREVLDRTAAAQVRDVLLPAIDWGSLVQMETLVHPEIRFWKMAGLHPCEIGGSDGAQEQVLGGGGVANGNMGAVENVGAEENAGAGQELVSGKKSLRDELMARAEPAEIVGIGETGLDYYWSTDHVEAQKESLAVHFEVAKELGKPVVLHNRESTEDLLAMVREYQDGRLRGVWHCFNGTVEQGREAMDLGLYLGIGGVVTFKNGGVAEVVRALPLDRMLLETDAPYLTPTPHRGSRNEPSYVPLIAEKLAAVKEVSVEEVAEVTTRNAYALFGLGKRGG